jgi:translation initiation factor 2B subunit (eIF-2B alpha/beta/delta family)
MIKEALTRAVEELRGDNTSGASALTGRVFDAFLLYLASTQRKERCYNDLRALAKALSGSQPGMTSVHNAAWMCAEGLKRSSWRGYEDLLKRLQGAVAGSGDRIAHRALPLFRPGASVLTLSYSNHVLRALKAAHAAGALSEVFVLESRPRLEGQALARDLGTLGISHTLLADAAGAQGVEAVDLVLTGCDALLEDGSVVNKVGTLGLALACDIFSVPFHCLCEALKVDPNHSLENPPTLKEGPSEELVTTPSPGTKARNPYYDITPARLVRGVVWEEGVIPPTELPRRFGGLLELLDYYERSGAPPPMDPSSGPSARLCGYPP